MQKNYLKIALRNLVKHRAYTFINVAGLSVGMACCILILLYVQDELSFVRNSGGILWDELLAAELRLPH